MVVLVLMALKKYGKKIADTNDIFLMQILSCLKHVQAVASLQIGHFWVSLPHVAIVVVRGLSEPSQILKSTTSLEVANKWHRHK